MDHDSCTASVLVLFPLTTCLELESNIRGYELSLWIPSSRT